MSLLYHISKSGSWDDYRNSKVKCRSCYYAGRSQTADYFPFKLHISIPPNYFDRVIARLLPILMQATLNLVIPGFKIFRRTQDSSYPPRNTHWPITIYLHEKFNSQNAAKVLRLVLKIEAKLKKYSVPAGDFSQLYVCDLPLLTNTSFRCSTINPQENGSELTYYKASSQYAPIMKKHGEESPYYTYFKTELTLYNNQTSSCSLNSVAPANSSENSDEARARSEAAKVSSNLALMQEITQLNSALRSYIIGISKRLPATINAAKNEIASKGPGAIVAFNAFVTYLIGQDLRSLEKDTLVQSAGLTANEISVFEDFIKRVRRDQNRLSIFARRTKEEIQYQLLQVGGTKYQP